MKIGMISFAHMHAYDIADQLRSIPEAELIGVWDDQAERGAEAAKRYGVDFYAELQQLLQTDIDAVVVCSENSKHKEHVLAAAAAKKHILCEKPIATEVADAKEMIRACKEAGVILQIAYPVRYASSAETVKNIIQSGQLGEVVAINSTNHGKMPGGWFVEPELSGGGAAIDHIVHIMDLLHWIFDCKAERVYAELGNFYYDLKVEDGGIVLLELENGVKVSLDPSWSRPETFPTWGDLILDIIGTKGTLTFDLFKPASVFYNDQAKKIEQRYWGDNTVQLMVADFVDAVQKNRPAFITGEDGLHTLEVVKAAYRSSKLGDFVNLKE